MATLGGLYYLQCLSTFYEALSDIPFFYITCCNCWRISGGGLCLRTWSNLGTPVANIPCSFSTPSVSPRSARRIVLCLIPTPLGWGFFLNYPQQVRFEFAPGAIYANDYFISESSVIGDINVREIKSCFKTNHGL